MSEKKTQEALCRSVFRDGTQKTSRERYTQAWVELIGRLEKNRAWSARPAPEREKP